MARILFLHIVINIIQHIHTFQLRLATYAWKMFRVKFVYNFFSFCMPFLLLLLFIKSLSSGKKIILGKISEAIF